MSTRATTTAEHATHWVDDWILRHGVTLTPAAKGALRDLLVDQTAELERGHHRFGELTDERRGAIAERDRLAAAHVWVLVECDALTALHHEALTVSGRPTRECEECGWTWPCRTRRATDAIRAAIKEPTQ